MAEPLPRGYALPRIAASVVWIAWAVATWTPTGANAVLVFVLAFTAAICVAVAMLVGQVARAAGSRSRWDARRLYEPAINVVVGATAAIVLTLLTSAVGITQPLSPWVTVVVSAVVTGWGLTAMDVLVVAHRRFALERQRLASTATALEQVSTSQTSLLVELRASIITAVEAELAPARDAIGTQLSMLDQAIDDDFWSTAPRLHDVAHDSVRPLVSALGTSPSSASTALATASFFRSVMRTQPLRPIPLAALYVIATLPGYWERFGATQALGFIAVGVALIFSIASGANRLMAVWPGRHTVLFLTGIMALQIPSIAFALTSADELTADVFVRLVGSGVASTVAVLLVSSIGSWRSRNEHALAAFRRHLDQELDDASARARLSALVARDAARMLHGPVQARLTACALAIDGAVATRDIDAYAKALREAHDVLGSPMAPEACAELDRTVEDGTAQIASLWRGLVNVHRDLGPGTGEVGGRQAVLVARICEEAVTNAVRHGGATEVQIHVRFGDGGLHVNVRDNGTGPAGGPPGLGTTMIGDATEGRWSLGSAPGGGGVLTASVRT